MKPEHIQAASDLASNPSFKLLKQALLEQLSDDTECIIKGSDSLVSRSYVHDVGVRNFFRWVERAASSATDPILQQTIKPFNHYGEETTTE